VGSLPPPDGDRARALRTEVTRILADGNSVDVVALDPVATAHRYLGPGGIVGCLRLATMVAGYDSVVVQLEPGLPVRARAGRAERALSLLAFSLALGRARVAVVRLECLEDVPGGLGGRAAVRAWRNAGQIVVRDELERASFVSSLGRDGPPVVVSAPRTREVDPREGSWGEGAEASAENVLGLVRLRAARERRDLALDRSARVIGWDRLPAPGVPQLDFDVALPETSQTRAGLGGLARSALAAADRRPLLRPAAMVVRAARRNAYAVLRPDLSD